MPVHSHLTMHTRSAVLIDFGKATTVTQGYQKRRVPAEVYQSTYSDMLSVGGVSL